MPTKRTLEEILDINKAPKASLELLYSIRGQALVGYALEMSIGALSKVKGRYKQLSTIADMQEMLDNIFFIGKAQK
jgi:hypothetical protein